MVNDNIRSILDDFFEDVREQCWEDSMETMIKISEIEGLTDRDIDEICNYLEMLSSSDDTIYVVSNITLEEDYLSLRKSIVYSLSVEYCEDTLYLIADFRYCYEKYGQGDVVKLSANLYDKILEEYDECDDD